MTSDSHSAADTSSPLRRVAALFALIVAGETVFLLPFIVARVFRPTLLDVFGLSNFQLGAAFSVYGVVAMVSYALGGPLADRFPARGLLAVALLATAAGGGVYAGIPDVAALSLLYGFWGLSSILLFWAALIRATREWGGANFQGRAYGVLDGGRGLLAAVLASFTVAVFAALLPDVSETATLADRRGALQTVIVLCTGFTVAVAGLVWWLVPDTAPQGGRGAPRPAWADVLTTVRMPQVWLQALIILCAYVAYKATDNFSLFARDALGYDDVAAAQLGTVGFWMRPLAAVAAGWLADRLAGSRVIVGGFAVIAVGMVLLASGVLPLAIPAVLVVTVAATSIGVYAVRGVYYAIMGEAAIPMAVTGTAVGLVSVAGYTPDIFAGPLIGYLLDASPGAAGHQHVFLMLAGFAMLGLMAALAFRRVCQRDDATLAASSR